VDNTWFERHPYPVLMVIAGPSGVGKDTIARDLIDRQPDGFYFVVTATTRAPRPDEIDGVDYFFVSEEEFARMINENELIEYAIVYNDYKGVPKQQIREALASGRDVIMRVDVQGAATIRKLIPNAVTVFLTAESESSMVRRLRERQSESDSQLSLRIATARKEMHRIPEFNYVVVNEYGAQKKTVDTLYAIIAAEKARVNQTPVQV
jgi:guanylate kinase